MLLKENISEKLLVIELSKGNEKAFKSLYDKYRPDIYAYSYSLLKSSANAKEIVQEVFLKVWINRNTLNPDLSFKSFIFTITRHLSFNFLKKAACDKKLRDEIFIKPKDSYNPVENQILEAEYEQMRRLAIDRLSPKRKLIFTMSREEDKSYEEISSELHISLSTVKNHMSKSLDALRTYLEINVNFILLLVLFTF